MYILLNDQITKIVVVNKPIKETIDNKGFTINKELQKGAMTGIVYKNAPQGRKLKPLKAFAYKHLGRHLMNRNVKKIRNA